MPTNIASANMVLVIGTLTKDSQVRHFDKSIKVTHNLALTKSYKGRDGKTQESTCYVSVIQWFKASDTELAEFSQGDTIMVQGELKTESWEDKATQKRQYMLVIDGKTVTPIKTHRRRQDDSQPDLEPERDTKKPGGRVADKDIPKPGDVAAPDDDSIPF